MSVNFEDLQKLCDRNISIEDYQEIVGKEYYKYERCIIHDS